MHLRPSELALPKSRIRLARRSLNDGTEESLEEGSTDNGRTKSQTHHGISQSCNISTMHHVIAYQKPRQHLAAAQKRQSPNHILLRLSDCFGESTADTMRLADAYLMRVIIYQGDGVDGCLDALQDHFLCEGGA